MVCQSVACLRTVSGTRERSRVQLVHRVAAIKDIQSLPAPGQPLNTTKCQPQPWSGPAGHRRPQADSVAWVGANPNRLVRWPQQRSGNRDSLDEVVIIPEPADHAHTPQPMTYNRFRSDGGPSQEMLKNCLKILTAVRF